MAGRISQLNDPEFAQQVAELYAAGTSKKEMAETLGCYPDTIPRWVRDPRVQAYVTRITQERVNRITRRVDSEMEARLAHVSGWDLQDLLKVRKEYLERALKAGDAGTNVAATTDELSEAMDADPELAEQLRKLVEK